MKKRTTVVAVCLVSLCAVGAWWWSTRPPRWNLVLITLDTTRADRLGCYGHAVALTPNLDRLASRGVLFEQAYTVVPITLPAHATLHTGLLPPEHGLRINSTSRLGDDLPTLAEILNRRGYRTGAFVSSLVLDARFGLARGFADYDDRLGNGPGGPKAERSAAKTVSAALAWLETDSSQPFFCWVHLYDPHEPYDDHLVEFGDQFQGRPYDGEIAFMDRQLGRLLDALSQRALEDRTLIVIVGDHGEGLGEHQEATHGYLAYNSTLHVPLLVKPPRILQPGRRIQEPISLVDVFPTILDGLGISPASTISGRSLQPALQNIPLEGRPCYAETQAPLMEGGWSPLRSWITSRWKLIQTTRPELYDLQADPDEQQNVFDQQPVEAAQLSLALTDFESKLKLRQGAATLLSAEERRALAGLGYTGGHTPSHGTGDPRRDIKDTILYAEQVHQCMHLIDQNELQRAQRILESVVVALPDYPKAWGTLGVCCAKQDDYVRAEQHFRRALALDANQNFARIGLGRALFAQDRCAETIEHLQTAVADEPAALDAQYFLGEACRKLGRWDESRSAFEAAINLAPDFTAARLGLADVARDAGRWEEAVELYRTALERDPGSTIAYLRIGHVLTQAGREAEAVLSFEELLHRSPRHVEGLTEFARFLVTAQDPSIQNLTRAVDLAEQACRLTKRQQVAPLMALAAAHAARGQLDRAIAAAELALEIARSRGPAANVTDVERELTEYQMRRENPPAKDQIVAP